MKIKYPAPKTKEGKIQHVPVVLKNRDVLIGHIQASQSILESLSSYQGLDDEMLTYFDPGVDSTRFNNWIQDGLNATGMNQDEINKIMHDKVNDILNRNGNHSENQSGIIDPGYFSLDCECGNFVKWNSPKELPEETFKCDICDRILIHYIYLDDEDIEFDDGKDVC